MRWMAAILVLALALTVVQADDDARGLAVFKLGEQYATDEHAGEAIDALCKYLNARIEDANFKRTGVRNRPDDALRLIRDQKPAAAIVSPGFYFKHKESLKLTVLAEARRGGHDGEQYSLVGTSKVDEYPAGKTIATTLTADLDWLKKAVLPAPEGVAPVRWVQFDNLFDAGYAIIDEEDDAPDFVLVDRITLQAFKGDPDLAELEQGLQSKVLPQDLVVEIDERLGETRDELKKVLKALNKDEEGRRLGELLQSPTFQAPDTDRLKETGKPWQRKD
jgi:hypothetical protein